MSDPVAIIEIRALPMARVRPDPTQPRQIFDEADIAELAASIRENGLLQPILVRPSGTGWLVVAGERRYRAHIHNKAETINAIVRDMAPGDVFAAQIIENLQRTGISPLEEAAAYQRLVDEMGGDVEAAAKRLGMRQPWRITERTCLLRLDASYQKLLASGQLKSTEAYEMAQLSSIGQAKLFRAIRLGQCQSYRALRAAAMALREVEAQASLLGDNIAPPAPTEDEIETMTRLERRIIEVTKLVAAGFDDNELVIARKVDPGKASTFADKLALIQKALNQMELALRAAAVQADLLAA